MKRTTKKTMKLDCFTALYYETGFDYFARELNYDAWPQHKEVFMARWMRFRPFEVDGIIITPIPGTRPAAWWQETGYHRKVTRGRPCKDMEQEYRLGMPRFWDTPEAICEPEHELLNREGLLTEHEKKLLAMPVQVKPSTYVTEGNN